MSPVRLTVMRSLASSTNLLMDRTSPLPKRLKAARLRAGLSQRQLGIAAGMDEFSASPRVNQYERGKHTPDFHTAERMANSLGCPTAYLYTREDDLAKLILLWADLPERQRRQLLSQHQRRKERRPR